jgi:hypothetical protein
MLARKLIPDIEYSAIIDSSQIGAIKPEEVIFARQRLAVAVSRMKYS